MRKWKRNMNRSGQNGNNRASNLLKKMFKMQSIEPQLNKHGTTSTKG